MAGAKAPEILYAINARLKPCSFTVVRTQCPRLRPRKFHARMPAVAAASPRRVKADQGQTYRAVLFHGGPDVVASVRRSQILGPLRTVGSLPSPDPIEATE